MKKLFLILSLFASLSLEAQFVTTFAKNASDSQEDGVFYYLPRNVIRLEFTVDETDYYLGPYAEFATKMLGINDYVKENKTEFDIKNIDIQLINEADPNAVYCVSSDEKSKEPLPSIILDYDGLILAFGYDSIPLRMKTSRNTFTDNDLGNSKRQDVSFIEILENEIERDDDDEEGKAPKAITKEDKAKLALEKISKIRASYVELVSGYQEVSYGNTLPYMVDNMQNIENEYVSLFKGKIVKNTYKKVIYFAPEENQANASVSIAKLSNSDGIVEIGGRGETIKIQFESKNSLANVNKMNDDVKNASQTNKLFYRIPAESDVKVIVGNKILAEKQLTISQFGTVKTLSVKNSKILFNPNTGQIISVVH